MSGVGNMAAGITSIGRLRSAIRDLPLGVRSAVAKESAAVLTRELQDDFRAGRTVYDTPRPLSVTGKLLTLVSTKGERHVRDMLAFVDIGTIVRAQLGTKYARYLIGKYAILPQSLPASWRILIEKIVADYRKDWAELHGAST